MELTSDQTINFLNREIKKEYRSLRNRLQSIVFDHKFLDEQVKAVFPDYPIIPNERCGVWYCDPKDYLQTSYFKSTDGHTNQWDFSLRRLNFHLLPALAASGGIVVVDSTRRGKRMPDALSKTVPIWCAVLNSLLLEYQGLEGEVLFCPPQTVSEFEFERIKSRIPDLVAKFKKMNILTGADIDRLFKGKILRPLWVFPGASLLSSQRDPFTGEVLSQKWHTAELENFIPVVLCTVSYQCQDGVDKRHGFTYVQGAADDHELWAQGLTAELFWKHISILSNINLSDQELESFVEDKIHPQEPNSAENGLSLDQILYTDILTEELHLGKISSNVHLGEHLVKELRLKYSLVIILSNTVTLSEDEAAIKIFKLQSECKKSSKALRTELIKICPLAEAYLPNSLPMLVCCNTGKDMSVCVSLAILCRNYNVGSWDLNVQQSIHKIDIKKHLSKIITKLEGRNVNPPRASLNSVNAYLM
ncbi:tRNA A64-2'-O-ribosylphosphate transferase [Lachancea thermotolerans CBS 6340]|uniref:KLTH0C03696p n=1 Tax=Lachancea thermotolerans (strain ATCC 56472 / CBS 6340 / NRRL Y-8284) TaxID=559295 RepID=C5DDT7_LACTC|nr:KLTH0C03696p [Lachancea thermotolerans CBS 6340]CAR21948.1 KLTH0C03696p [Lachancea thermotolerans CBS 6340]